MPCEPIAIYLIIFNIYQDHNINPFYTCKSTVSGKQQKKEHVTAINQCSLDYWIHINQYVEKKTFTQNY